MPIQSGSPLDRYDISAGNLLGRLLVSDRVFGLKIAVSVGLTASFLLSPKLWISSRSYPLTPVWSFLRPIGFPFDYAVFVALLVLLALIVVISRPAKLIVGFVSLAIVCAFFDQSRWQPWFYQYLFMLAALAVLFANQATPEKQISALHTCRLIVASIYFWSGIEKLNMGFVQNTFPWMLEPLTTFLPRAAKPWLHPLGFAAPFIELGIGVGLLTRKFRTEAIVAALAMHLFILASIGPLGRNYNNVIWPWNVAMSAFVVLLFWKENEIRIENVVWGNKTAFHILVLLLFGIAPALSLFNRWDSYLSFALYSGNRNVAKIYMTGDVAGRLPGDVQEFVTEGESQVDQLAISDWSWGELNVPPYPEIRIFKNIGRRVCEDAANPSDMRLVVQGKMTWFQPRRQLVFDCGSLSK